MAGFPFPLGGDFDADFAAFVDAVSFFVFAALETRVSVALASDASASADRFLGGIITCFQHPRAKGTRQSVTVAVGLSAPP